MVRDRQTNRATDRQTLLPIELLSQLEIDKSDLIIRIVHLALNSFIKALYYIKLLSTLGLFWFLGPQCAIFLGLCKVKTFLAAIAAL